jgi:hypothetical protein
MKDTGKLRWALGLFVALSFAAIGVACDDEGDDVVGSMADAAVDAPVQTDVSAGDTMKPVTTFGSTCVADSGCSGVVDYCAKAPGSSATTAGICTKKACDTAPAGTCPVSQPCTNVAPYVGLTTAFHICINPDGARRCRC